MALSKLISTCLQLYRSCGYTGQTSSATIYLPTARQWFWRTRPGGPCEASRREKEVLGFRAVVPVSKDGRHIGTFEYGSAFGDVMVKELAVAMQSSIGVYLAHDGQFDVLGTAFPASFKPKQEVLAAAIHDAQFEPAVPVGDATLAMRFTPILDFSGKAVAVAVFGVDRHQFQEMLNSNLSRIGTVTLLALLLLWAMALTFMRRVVRPITNLVSDMRRLADGDLSVIPAEPHAMTR